MTSQSNQPQEATLDALFDCLASNHRRRLLGTLQADGAMTRSKLATVIVSQVKGTPPTQVTDDEHEQSELVLHHVHLPMLDAAGLLDYDSTEAIVEPADHPAFRDPDIQKVLAGEATTDSELLDQLFEALADHRRRSILDVLSHQYHSIHVETLARELIARSRGSSEQAAGEEPVEALLISLYHNELPLLQDAELIDYDTEEGTVTYEGHPDLRVPWMHSQLGPNFRASLTNSPPDAQVGDIEGRENVVSFGQSLVDKADDELFMMFTTTGLLEAGCFTRIKQAAERGVDVYLGTRDPTVREFVQEHTPSVTLWEPETNWLNLPVEEDNLGRLVFADREAVMIGTLGEKIGGDLYEEQAIVGEGADNTLVVLLRQMLRGRLEQFAEPDEATETEIQF